MLQQIVDWPGVQGRFTPPVYAVKVCANGERKIAGDQAVVCQVGGEEILKNPTSNIERQF